MEGLDPAARIEKIEWAPLPGRRPRAPKYNARVEGQGRDVPQPTIRVTIGGSTGFGWSDISRSEAQALVGASARDCFTKGGRVCPPYLPIEFPLLDWLGHRLGLPVYALGEGHRQDLLRVPCYDTSLYIDDLHITDDLQAATFMGEEARQGFENGHRNFKLKIGRGARYMSLEKGTARDIAVIHGVREAIGPDAQMMVDANNGYNLNLTKTVLAATRADRILWIEEPFHEDAVLYRDLKAWLHDHQISTFIADGEGVSDPRLVQWAMEGLVDVIQYDLLDYGFGAWVSLGAKLDGAGRLSAPHNYGGPYGNYATAHLAPRIKGLRFIEWDTMAVSGLDDSQYRIEEGVVTVPSTPGLGVVLDDSYFSRCSRQDGWSVDRRY